MTGNGTKLPVNKGRCAVRIVKGLVRGKVEGWPESQVRYATAHAYFHFAQAHPWRCEATPPRRRRMRLNFEDL